MSNNNKMNLFGSHNSLSSYNVKQWWLKPFNIFSKCQDKTLKEQWDAGVRSFDLRVRKYKDDYYGAHGLVLYDITLKYAMQQLNFFAEEANEVCYFRIVSENAIIDDDYDALVDHYKLFIRPLQHENLKCLGIFDKEQWNSSYIDVRYASQGNCWLPNNRSGIAEAVANIVGSKPIEQPDMTYDVTFLDCYISKGIPALLGIPFPSLAAKVLNPIALNKRQHYDNELKVLDFV